MTPIRRSLLTACALAALIVSAPYDARAEDAPAAPAAKPKACSGPEYRQFDFWLGTWEVRMPDGTLAGNNRIEADVDGCAVIEHWTGAQGGRGTSLNFYDAATKRWSQTWIDNHGSPLRLEGAFRDGHMVLAGDQTGADGKTTRNRLTWTPRPDRHVRQLWESSTDGGTTWTVEFDGDYAPKPAS